MSSIDCAYDEILRQKREDGAAEPSSKEAKICTRRKSMQQRESKRSSKEYEDEKYRQGIYNTGQLQRYVRGWCRGGWSRASRRDESSNA